MVFNFKLNVKMNKKFKYCFKDGKLVKLNEHENNSDVSKNVRVDEVIFEGDKCKILTNTGTIYKDVNAFFCRCPLV